MFDSGLNWMLTIEGEIYEGSTYLMSFYDKEFCQAMLNAFGDAMPAVANTLHCVLQVSL